MDGYLRQKLSGAKGNMFVGTFFRKPESSYQPLNQANVWPDSSSFVMLNEESCPQLSGFLDETAETSMWSNEVVLKDSGSLASSNLLKNINEGNFASRMQTNDGSGLTSLVSDKLGQAVSSGTTPNTEKVITSDVKGEDDWSDHSTCPTDSNSVGKDSSSVELKNGTFDLSSKENSATQNATFDMQDTKDKNVTFETTQENVQQLKRELNLTVDISVQSRKSGSGNGSVDLGQALDSKEATDVGQNATVKCSNLNGTYSKSNYTVENISSSNATLVNSNEKPDGVTDDQSHEKNKNMNAEECKAQTPLTSNADKSDVQSVSFSLHSGDHEKSSSVVSVPDEKIPSNSNLTNDLTIEDVRNLTVELKPSSTELPNQVNSVLDVKQPSINQSKKEVETNSSALAFCSEANIDSAAENNPKTSERSEVTDSSEMEIVNRSGVFCLDDTLDIKSCSLVTSTPICFGRESRFEIPKDAKPTSMRTRLPVINSIEEQSTEELAGASSHNRTNSSLESNNSSQNKKLSVNSESNTSKPVVNKPVINRLPQLSSKLNFPRAGLPRAQSLINSSVAVRPKVLCPPVPQQPDVSLNGKKTLPLSKGKTTGALKITHPARMVKVPVVSAATENQCSTVKPPLSLKSRTGLQPPTRKRPGLKTPQTNQSFLKAPSALSSIKATEVPGVRTKNSLLPSVAQKHFNSDCLSSPKRKRIAPAGPNVLPAAELLQPPDVTPHSDCANCSHKQNLELLLREIAKLRTECKDQDPIKEKLKKLQMFGEEMK